MAQISVVVPVYKVRAYLHKCVDSILNQSFQDMEVILVDDGCPDSCGAICEEYAKKDSRVKVVHKENGGLSDARNAGLQYVTSEYVIFIDSDDYIKRDMLEYLYHNIKEHNADIATCGVYDVYESKTVDAGEAEEIFECDAQTLYSYILLGKKVRGEIWNKLMRRDLIGDIRFPKGKLYEDIYFLADIMPLVKKACVGTAPKYFYLHREGSITGKPYRKQLLDIIEGYEKTYQTVLKSFPALREEAHCLRLWSRFIILDKIMEEKNYRQVDQFQIMLKYLKNHRGEILRNRYFNKGRKVSIIILCISLKLYRQLVLVSVRKQQKSKEK